MIRFKNNLLFCQVMPFRKAPVLNMSKHFVLNSRRSAGWQAEKLWFWRIKPTRRHLLFYCTSYRLNMFRALLCRSSPEHYSILTAPNLQPTANQERNDQCGNQHYSRELLMLGILVPETCWAYKKYNKIISGMYLAFILQLSQWCTVQQTSHYGSVIGGKEFSIVLSELFSLLTHRYRGVPSIKISKFTCTHGLLQKYLFLKYY